jgi:hypothetical protein
MVFALLGTTWGTALHALPSHGLAIYLALECDQSPPIVSGTGSVAAANGSIIHPIVVSVKFPQETYFDVLWARAVCSIDRSMHSIARQCFARGSIQSSTLYLTGQFSLFCLLPNKRLPNGRGLRVGLPCTELERSYRRWKTSGSGSYFGSLYWQRSSGLP